MQQLDIFVVNVWCIFASKGARFLAASKWPAYCWARNRECCHIINSKSRFSIGALASDQRFVLYCSPAGELSSYRSVRLGRSGLAGIITEGPSGRLSILIVKYLRMSSFKRMFLSYSIIVLEGESM